MPLPPALAAKLAKRGIIKTGSVVNEKASEPESEAKLDHANHLSSGVTEEIIAESYDTLVPPGDETTYAAAPFVAEQVIAPYLGYSLCPNKWNAYHDCTPGCQRLWGKVPRPLDAECERRRIKMLAKYPLPENWQEILDPGVGRHYYWNCDNDFVSWLPPGHPKCQVTRSAAELRRVLHTEREQRLAEEEEDKQSDESDKSDREDDDESSSSSSDSEAEVKGAKRKRSHSVQGSEDESEESGDDSTTSVGRQTPPPPPPQTPPPLPFPSSGAPPPPPPSASPSRRERSRQSERREGSRGDRRPRHERFRRRRDPNEGELDPMDPASYGDCPRGTWSSGLPDRTDAKTGVDTTASGQLYQQRPYPSPGTVLKLNATTPVGPVRPEEEEDGSK